MSQNLFVEFVVAPSLGHIFWQTVYHKTLEDALPETTTALSPC
jgi:hypothetical protein